MRALFGCLAVVLGAISITLAARYGYKGAPALFRQHRPNLASPGTPRACPKYLG
jgi:hypothetical protein